MAKSKKNKNQNSAIDAKMSIAELIFRYPETVDVFLKHGFHCFGCIGASFENLKQAAKIHGIDLKKIMEDLSKVIKK